MWKEGEHTVKSLILMNIILTAAILTIAFSIKHELEFIHNKLATVRPISNITTEFVVVNDCKEDFDVREFNSK